MSGSGASKGGSASASFNTSFSDINAGLFGQDVSTTGTTKGTTKEGGVTTQKNFFDKRSLEMIIENVLAQGGLAEIFTEENAAGIYNSSVAKQASGDLLGNIARELAILTGEQRTGISKTTKVDQTTTNESESSGILDTIGGLF